ncbi:MAG TPA: alpha-(1-_3)-arabinofuranosyltransferase family protein, partial [Acidimicrobiia bacterium]|nr:alpha-(1->3)-arabinofuranosyltransferase family protein [Acidimicrobiia bacterium]
MPVRPAVDAVSARTPPVSTVPASTPALGRARAPGYLLLAALAYLPVLRSDPGRLAADTKTYLFLDPSRLLGRAWSMWDPNIGLGTVSHQTIGYLFPMGPFFWLGEAVGLPDWVTQRLWLGSIIFAAGLGVLFLLRTLGQRGPGVVVATLVFILSPYVLDYSSRISVILLPWAALPWLLALTIRALRDGGWRYPVLIAIVVQVVGGVNATALLFAGLAPALWIPFSVWGLRETSGRRAFQVVWRTGLVTVLCSLWWMAGLWAQGGYGLDVLQFTETVRAVSRTSLAPEVLRGLGYWFFYGQDKLGPWTESSVAYTQRPLLILVGYSIPALAFLAAAVIRWRYRTYFVLLLAVGVAIAVGTYPYDAPSPAGSIFRHLANSSSAGLALRSTGRATPLVVLAVAVLLGMGINALATRFSDAATPRRWIPIGAAVGVGALAVANFPSLWTGTYYGSNLERDADVPQYWQDAIAALDGRPYDTRILELPGSDFASYVWGNTVDPITPGLTDRPYVARELIPWGSPASADLVNALDRRIQEGLFEPDALAPVARLLAAGDVVLRNDLQTDRYNLVKIRTLWRQFDPPPDGLGEPET